MLEGLNSAAAGMAAQQQRIDAVANDLANANTTGYKRLRVGFRDLVYTQAGRPPRRARAPAPAPPRSTPAARFAQGTLQRTDQPLDVAIQGEGFLRVRLARRHARRSRATASLQLDGSGRS